MAAAASYGHDAEIVATTTKLARALWIVPVTLAVQALAAWRRGSVETLGAPAKARRPWFILGFLAMAALVTFVPVLATPGAWLAAAARRSLVLTLFLLGTGISRDALRRIGVRPLVQGVVLWFIVASTTLLLVTRGVIK